MPDSAAKARSGLARCCFLLCLLLWLPVAAGAQDLSGSRWVFSIGNPLQPMADNHWTIVTGVPGAPLTVSVPRGGEPAALLEGSYDGKQLEVLVRRDSDHGSYRGSLSEDGAQIDGLYTVGPEHSLPFRLTRLDRMSSLGQLQIRCQTDLDDPELVICKASLSPLPVSASQLHYSWSLDGRQQPAMTADIRLTGVQPGAHRISVIAMDVHSQALTAPHSINFSKRPRRSWDGWALGLALTLLLSSALLYRGRRPLQEPVETAALEPVAAESGHPPLRIVPNRLRLRGDGRDQGVVLVEGGDPDQPVRLEAAPPRLLHILPGDSGFQLRSVLVGLQEMPVRLEVLRGSETQVLEVVVEPIFVEVQVTVSKPGFASIRHHSRMGALAASITGRVGSGGRPVAHAKCRASLKIDGGKWAASVLGLTDSRGCFRFAMPPRLVKVLHMEAPEWSVEPIELSCTRPGDLTRRGAARSTVKGGRRNDVLKLPAGAGAWLSAIS
ncbi:hypothetical protein IV102_32415 [bacterium]|nr:hypothetical protein [bacterium]